MPDNKRILIAVDRTAASQRAVAYVVNMLGGAPGIHVGLLHVDLPPRMLEWGGSEDPRTEERVSAERAVAYQQEEKQAVHKGQAFLQRFRETLAERGIDVAALLVQFDEPLNAKSITEHILSTAKKHDYGTAVVGRDSFGGLIHFFKHHVGEELVRHGEGLTIWVVE